MRVREEGARFMASIRGNAAWPCGLSLKDEQLCHLSSLTREFIAPRRFIFEHGIENG
jgi:hypothetical protein